MEEGAKGLVKEVKALPKRIRDTDCFQVRLLRCWAGARPCQGCWRRWLGGCRARPAQQRLVARRMNLPG